MWKRNNGTGRGRGRGGGPCGRGRPFQNTGRIDFSAIGGALTSKKRKRHIHEGLCFIKCKKKGHRLFNCPELKGKGAVVAPSKKELWWQGCSNDELE
jgi:hypothetical protein